ncbi:MAG: transcriptional repressor [bacterium]
MQRLTRQRQIILDLLRAAKTHPTADWIYDQAKKKISSLSIATVYRNLKILARKGQINELPFGDTFDRYDADTSSHPHFVCTACGEVIDMHCRAPWSPPAEAAQKGLEIERELRVFYGKCLNCRSKGEKNET